MAVSVAPLTTTVMNSVKADHAGIASGVNNAVSRTAGLLAVAVFGLIMFQAFNSHLDQRLNAIPMPAEARQAVNTERLKLAAAEIPTTLPDETRLAIRTAILESFVFGFRRVMLVGAALTCSARCSPGWRSEVENDGRDKRVPGGAARWGARPVRQRAQHAQLSAVDEQSKVVRASHSGGQRLSALS